MSESSKSENPEMSNKKFDIGGFLEKVFEQVVDPETKDFIGKFASSENLDDKINCINEFGKKIGAESSFKFFSENSAFKNDLSEAKNDIDILVNEKRLINERISKLGPQDQKEFYSKFYEIPTERNIHNKLDSILEKIEDMQTELSILRKHSVQK